MFTLKLKEVWKKKWKKTVPNIFSNYFVNITKLLNILEWKPEETRNNTDSEKILEGFKNNSKAKL